MPKQTGRFYINVFDPQLILAQIITVQCLWYLALGGFIVMADRLLLVPVTLDQFFDADFLDNESAFVFPTVASFVLNALTGAAFLLVVVERSKKCLDFAATVHIVHLVACCIYAGWPSHWEWWVTHSLCLTAMAVLGEFLCIRRELTEINLTGRKSDYRMSAV